MTFSKTTVSSIISTQTHTDLIKVLVERLGEPIDSYWNGSHTWFTENNNFEFEWRLHPVSGFKMPEASRPEDLLELALEAEIEIDHYWEGLEVFCISEELISPEDLQSYVESTINIKPEICGYVDHEHIGNEFERTGGNISIIQLLTSQLDEDN